MQTLFEFFLTIFFLVLVAGLVKPELVLKKGTPTRGRVLKIYGISYLALALVGSFFFSPTDTVTTIASVPTPEKTKQFKHEKMSLTEYMDESKKHRKQIALDYVEFHKLDAAANEQFHACMSYMGRKKSKSLTVGEVLSWCLKEYQHSPSSLSVKYVDYDKLEEQFSSWDGSHYELEQYIKRAMNNPKSYEHISTIYRLVLDEKNRHMEVTSKFRGTNVYGAIVKNTVVAKINIDTGAVITMDEVN